jgi:hypothetical protein
MTNATQAGGFECQFGGGDVDAHASYHDRNQFLLAEFQAEIIYSFHGRPWYFEKSGATPAWRQAAEDVLLLSMRST